jgi:hypothetical protein
MEKYEDMNKTQLKAIANGRKIKGFSTMSTPELVEALSGSTPAAEPRASAPGAIDTRPASVRMKKHHTGNPIDVSGMKEYSVTGGITSNGEVSVVAVMSSDGWVNAGNTCIDRGETVKMDPKGKHTRRFLDLGVIAEK